MHACVLSSHHEQSLVGIDDAQPNGHVGVLTVLQKGTDGDVSALGVRLLLKGRGREFNANDSSIRTLIVLGKNRTNKISEGQNVRQQ